MQVEAPRELEKNLKELEDRLLGDESQDGDAQEQTEQCAEEDRGEEQRAQTGEDCEPSGARETARTERRKRQASKSFEGQPQANKQKVGQSQEGQQPSSRAGSPEAKKPVTARSHHPNEDNGEDMLQTPPRVTTPSSAPKTRGGAREENEEDAVDTTRSTATTQQQTQSRQNTGVKEPEDQIVYEEEEEMMTEETRNQ